MSSSSATRWWRMYVLGFASFRKGITVPVDQ